MATTIDYSGVIKRITVLQADLTLISGNLYELDTDTFFDDVKALEANEAGIVWENAIDHNLEYTVAGTTYARKIEIMNSTNFNPVLNGPNSEEYEVFISPDTTYSVLLAGSNNNLFDLQNAILANTVTQVIPQNSAGLIVVTTGSGLSAAQDTKLTNIDTRTTYHDKIINNLKELKKISSSWYLIIYDDGEVSGGTEILRKKLTDSTGADISDLTAGVLAAELESTA